MILQEGNLLILGSKYWKCSTSLWLEGVGLQMNSRRNTESFLSNCCPYNVHCFNLLCSKVSWTVFKANLRAFRDSSCTFIDHRVTVPSFTSSWTSLHFGEAGFRNAQVILLSLCILDSFHQCLFAGSATITNCDHWLKLLASFPLSQSMAWPHGSHEVMNWQPRIFF